jgi:cytochrome c oxidase subunit 2
MIEKLWWTYFWPTMIVFALVVAAVLVAFFFGMRRARERGPTPELARTEREERPLKNAVVASTAVSIVILFGLLVASIATGRELSGRPIREPVRVHVTAHRWWWELTYGNARISQITTTANELHVPVGRDVELELASADVIHSFWVPLLNGKRDLIPSHTTRLTLRVEEPGRYLGKCAEFCGFQHAHMDLSVIAEPPAVFERWLAAQRAGAPAPTNPKTAHGRDIFEKGPCAMCHAVQGTTASATVGPNLTHWASRRQIGAGAADNTRGYLAGWISDPQRLKPGANMPPIVLAPDDLDALIDYLETLK